MMKRLFRGLSLGTFLVALPLSAWAQVPFLDLIQATVTASDSRVELAVSNPESVDITVAGFQVTVIKQKRFLRSADPTLAPRAQTATAATVIGNVFYIPEESPVQVVDGVTATYNRFLTGISPAFRSLVSSLTPTSVTFGLLREQPAPVMTRSRLLPTWIKDIRWTTRPCYTCPTAITGITLTPTGPTDENTLWRSLDYLQTPEFGRHRHSMDMVDAVGLVSTVSGTALSDITSTDATGLASLQVTLRVIPTVLEKHWSFGYERFETAPAITSIANDLAPIIYECPLIYDPPPMLITAGQSGTLAFSMEDFSIGERACLPAPGDRVIIHAYDEIGAWVLQATKAAQ